jgi:hypothetical protein
MLEDIESKTPDKPAWVKGWQAKKAWNENHEWRCEAAETESKGPGYQQIRSVLLKRAAIIYGEDN